MAPKGEFPMNTHPMLEQLAGYLKGYPGFWCLAGECARDLLEGRLASEQKEVEIAVLRSEQALLRAYLKSWDLKKIIRGRLLPWMPGESLPSWVEQVHLFHGLWSLRFTFLDNEDISTLIDDLRVVTPAGIPVFRTEATLTRPI